jgi:hypothetical protein
VLVGGGALTAQGPPDRVDGSASASAVAVRVRPPGPTLGGCPMFPADNPWNQRVDSASVLVNSAAMIDKIQSVGGDNLHADFGEFDGYGIPFVIVPANQPLVPITYDAYGDESDPGPWPTPLDAPVEGAGDAGDRHVLTLRQDTCELFELYVGRRIGAGWVAESGARFNLRSNALRPDGWTSADAAGLPILPGLVRCDEVAAGQINHAIRVTFNQTRNAYIAPATHAGSSRTDPNLPAMGQRLRLRGDVDISGITGQARVILEAFRSYGLMVADNGSNWYFQGAPGDCWNDDDLRQLQQIPGTAFEVVEA